MSDIIEHSPYENPEPEQLEPMQPVVEQPKEEALEPEPLAPEAPLLPSPQEPEPKQRSSYEISKKELLAQTGISYGQLYRWKREGLIPEDWFFRRSAFTGQETFFPRELILKRVKAILSMKDDLSLSEIKEQLSQISDYPSLLQTLLATAGIEEGFLNSLDVDLDAVSLSEESIKAVAVLLSALRKADTSKDTQRALLTEAILALNTSDQSGETASSDSKEG